jgi:hypothetical protein
VRQFSGCEPLVGEIVGVRTFRVDESGLLLPLYSSRAWYDGPNTATCAPPTGEPERADHAVPGMDCECGFYAYGTEQAASHNRNARYVQAVVACWGGVVAGTQGVRSQHARIVAVWLHGNVPAWTRRRVATTYPSVAIYSDRRAMLAEHPLSALDCYQPAPPPRVLRRAAAALGLFAVFALGLVPEPLLRDSGPVRGLWLATTVTMGLLAGWPLVGARTPGHRAAAMVTAGVLAWLLAPLFGLAGWLLRAPVLRGVLVAGGGYLLSLRPGFFPVVHSERERAFCGVRA